MSHRDLFLLNEYPVEDNQLIGAECFRKFDNWKPFNLIVLTFVGARFCRGCQKSTLFQYTHAKRKGYQLNGNQQGH